MRSGARRLAGVGGDQELDALAALRVGAVGCRCGSSCDVEAAAAHAQFGDQRGGAADRCVGGLRGARWPSASAAWRQCAAGRVDFGVELRQAHAGAAQRVQFGGDARRAARPVAPAVTRCLRASSCMRPRRCSMRVERGRVEVEVAAHAVEQGQRPRRPGSRRRRAWRRRRPGAARVRPRAAGRARTCCRLRDSDGPSSPPRRANAPSQAAIRPAAWAWRRWSACRRAMASGSSVFAVEFGVLVLEPVDAVGDVALRRQRIAFAQQRAPARGGGLDRRDARPRCGRRRRAARAGSGATAAPGVRAGRGSRPAARPVRRAAPSVTGRPLTQAREPPSARITRRIWQPSSSSSSFSRSQARGQRHVVEGELGDQFGALGAVADHAAVGAQRRRAGPGHRPAATCRRRFRRRSRSGRGRSRVRRR